MSNTARLDRISTGRGPVAGRDQSGRSTPGTLRRYGLDEQAYRCGRGVRPGHRMGSRPITSPGFDGERILGAILLEQTMDRHIDGLLAAGYLWRPALPAR